MANLTVSVDDDVLRRARIRALEMGTSVNAVLRDYLATSAGESPTMEAMQSLVRAAKKARSGSGTTGRTWTREDAHER